MTALPIQNTEGKLQEGPHSALTMFCNRFASILLHNSVDFVDFPVGPPLPSLPLQSNWNERSILQDLGWNSFALLYIFSGRHEPNIYVLQPETISLWNIILQGGTEPNQTPRYKLSSTNDCACRAFCIQLTLDLGEKLLEKDWRLTKGKKSF